MRIKNNTFYKILSDKSDENSQKTCHLFKFDVISEGPSFK